MLEAVPVIITVIFSFVIKNVFGSTGDRSQMFYSCVKDCVEKNCSGNITTLLAVFCAVAPLLLSSNSQLLLTNTRFSTRFSVVSPIKTNAVDMLG